MARVARAGPEQAAVHGDSDRECDACGAVDDRDGARGHGAAKRMCVDEGGLADGVAQPALERAAVDEAATVDAHRDGQ